MLFEQIFDAVFDAFFKETEYPIVELRNWFKEAAIEYIEPFAKEEELGNSDTYAVINQVVWYVSRQYGPKADSGYSSEEIKEKRIQALKATQPERIKELFSGAVEDISTYLSYEELDNWRWKPDCFIKVKEAGTELFELAKDVYFSFTGWDKDENNIGTSDWDVTDIFEDSNIDFVEDDMFSAWETDEESETEVDYIEGIDKAIIARAKELLGIIKDAEQELDSIEYVYTSKEWVLSKYAEERSECILDADVVIKGDKTFTSMRMNAFRQEIKARMQVYEGYTITADTTEEEAREFKFCTYYAERMRREEAFKKEREQRAQELEEEQKRFEEQCRKEGIESFPTNQDFGSAEGLGFGETSAIGMASFAENNPFEEGFPSPFGGTLPFDPDHPFTAQNCPSSFGGTPPFKSDCSFTTSNQPRPEGLVTKITKFFRER